MFNSLFSTLYFDGSKSSDGVGVGFILIFPEGVKTMLTCIFEFECINNIAKYEVLVQGIYKAISLDVKYLQVYGDLEIVVKQVKNMMHCISTDLTHYQSLVQSLTSRFLAFNISAIPRIQNANVNLLTKIASKLIPSEDYSPDRFPVELIFRPSIPNNITNWKVFNDDEDILSFLNSEKSYDDQIVDDNEHDDQLKWKIDENPIPKSVVKPEDLYDLKDRFKRVTNSKLQSSTLRF